ncbi:hypothetical protein [Paraflavitalea speifideaquila]|uniref:hypothetical protein n=1 Tax=Paraflavitalea speifideaquila TaxID=3076558 RepID=UPI0028EC9FB5|nr:hypothetical protein [Paraflavitalea speifideiaquila]
MELTGISAYNININLAKSIVQLTNDMRIDRSYTTDCADCGLGAFNSYANNITDNRDTLLVSWPLNKWAKAYDLEWTYISNEAYTDNRYGTPGTVAFAQNIFRNNATRVTITGLMYNIPSCSMTMDMYFSGSGLYSRWPMGNGSLLNGALNTILLVGWGKPGSLATREILTGRLPPVLRKKGS